MYFFLARTFIICYSSLRKLIQRGTFISVIKMRKLKLGEEGFSPRYAAIHQQK